MTNINFEEIKELRNSFKELPEALSALDVIENHNGNLEAAVVKLSKMSGEPIQVNLRSRKPGEEPKTKIELQIEIARNKLEDEARILFCGENRRNELLTDSIAGAVGMIVSTISTPLIPSWLIVASVLYTYRIGVDKLCESWDED